MISPELLRKHSFFGFFSDGHYKAVAMIASTLEVKAGSDLLVAGRPVDGLYLLLEGSIDLYSVSEDKHDPKLRKEFLVGEISPGEPFGISVLNEPYLSIATARAAAACKLIKIEADGLRALCAADHDLGYALSRQISRAALERLAYTQAQLAAARA